MTPQFVTKTRAQLLKMILNCDSEGYMLRDLFDRVDQFETLVDKFAHRRAAKVKIQAQEDSGLNPQGKNDGLFTVRMLDRGPEIIQVIRVVRELTGFGLKEAKDLVEATRPVLFEAQLLYQAKEKVARLEKAGAKCEIIPD